MIVDSELIEYAIDECCFRGGDELGLCFMSPEAASIVVQELGMDEFLDWEVPINPTLPGISVAFHVS